MARVLVTFVVVWLAVGAVGVLVQNLITPVSPTVVSLVGLVIAAIAAFMVYRSRR